MLCQLCLHQNLTRKGSLLRALCHRIILQSSRYFVKPSPDLHMHPLPRPFLRADREPARTFPSSICLGARKQNNLSWDRTGQPAKRRPGLRCRTTLSLISKISYKGFFVNLMCSSAPFAASRIYKKNTNGPNCTSSDACRVFRSDKGKPLIFQHFPLCKKVRPGPSSPRGQSPPVRQKILCPIGLFAPAGALPAGCPRRIWRNSAFSQKPKRGAPGPRTYFLLKIYLIFL